MAASFHEEFSQEDVKLPSERSTGLVLAAATALIAIAWRRSPTVMWSAGSVSAVLLAFSLLAPAYLKPVNILWFRFSMLLHHIVTPVVMFAVFSLVFVPMGFLMRLKRDPLSTARQPDARSYWIDRKSDEAAVSSMTQPY